VRLLEQFDFKFIAMAIAMSCEPGKVLLWQGSQLPQASKTQQDQDELRRQQQNERVALWSVVYRVRQ
jgi:hypothetical protein